MVWLCVSLCPLSLWFWVWPASDSRYGGQGTHDGGEARRNSLALRHSWQLRWHQQSSGRTLALREALQISLARIVTCCMDMQTLQLHLCWAGRLLRRASSARIRLCAGGSSALVGGCPVHRHRQLWAVRWDWLCGRQPVLCARLCSGRVRMPKAGQRQRAGPACAPAAGRSARGRSLPVQRGNSRRSSLWRGWCRNLPASERAAALAVAEVRAVHIMERKLADRRDRELATELGHCMLVGESEPLCSKKLHGVHARRHDQVPSPE